MEDIFNGFYLINQIWKDYWKNLTEKNFDKARDKIAKVRDYIKKILFNISEESCFENVFINPEIALLIEELITNLKKMETIQERRLKSFQNHQDHTLEVIEFLESFFQDENTDKDELRMQIASFEEKYNKEDENEKYLYPILIFEVLYSSICLKKQIEVLKLTCANYILYKNDDSSEEEKVLARCMFQIYKDIFQYVRIDYFSFQEGDLLGTVENRCNTEHTTRFQVIFTLHNNDKYIMRVDAPHKGDPGSPERCLHINMHDVNDNNLDDYPFPFLEKSEDAESIDFLGDDFKKLFYHQEKMIWFKTQFLKKLDDLSINENNKKILENLFKKRLHYIKPWEGMIIKEKSIVSFFKKQNELIRNMCPDNSFSGSFEKDKEYDFDIMAKLRWVDKFWKSIFETIEEMGLGYGFQVAVWEYIYSGVENLKSLNLSIDSVITDENGDNVEDERIKDMCFDKIYEWLISLDKKKD